MGEDPDEGADSTDPKDQQQDAADDLSEGVDALADDAEDEQAVNPVLLTKDLWVLGGRAGRLRRWCPHRVSLKATRLRSSSGQLIDLRRPEWV